MKDKGNKDELRRTTQEFYKIWNILEQEFALRSNLHESTRSPTEAKSRETTLMAEPTKADAKLC